jgi:hypothetical protein
MHHSVTLSAPPLTHLHMWSASTCSTGVGMAALTAVHVYLSEEWVQRVGECEWVCTALGVRRLVPGHVSLEPGDH